MVALEISVNGRHVQTATVGEFGMIEAEVMWARFARSRVPGEGHNEGQAWSYGLKRHDHGTGRTEALRWPATKLQVGDVVTIRVVESEVEIGDAPVYRKMKGDEPQRTE